MMHFSIGDFSQNNCIEFPKNETMWINIDSLVLVSNNLKLSFKIRDMGYVSM